MFVLYYYGTLLPLRYVFAMQSVVVFYSLQSLHSSHVSPSPTHLSLLSPIFHHFAKFFRSFFPCCFSFFLLLSSVMPMATTQIQYPFAYKLSEAFFVKGNLRFYLFVVLSSIRFNRFPMQSLAFLLCLPTP